PASWTRPPSRLRTLRPQYPSNHPRPPLPLDPPLRTTHARTTWPRPRPRHPDLRLLRNFSSGRTHGLGATLRTWPCLHHNAGAYVEWGTQPEPRRCLVSYAARARRRVGGYRRGHPACQPRLETVV